MGGAFGQCRNFGQSRIQRIGQAGPFGGPGSGQCIEYRIETGQHRFRRCGRQGHLVLGFARIDHTPQAEQAVEAGGAQIGVAALEALGDLGQAGEAHLVDRHRAGHALPSDRQGQVKATPLEPSADRLAGRDFQGVEAGRQAATDFETAAVDALGFPSPG